MLTIQGYKIPKTKIDYHHIRGSLTIKPYVPAVFVNPRYVQKYQIYKETEEGYEEIGSYDPDTGELNIEEGEGEDEGEEVEAEDEEIETVEFTFKGKTYLRDEENNVYNEDGEEVGKWTGTAIKFPITRNI